MLLGGLAVAVALQQVGYSWFAFYRARGESWPQAVESGVLGASFVLLAVPGALLWGSWGFVGGRIGCTLCVLGRALGLRAAAAARRPAAAGGGAGRACRWRSRPCPRSRCDWRCGAANGRSGRHCWSWSIWLGVLAWATWRFERTLLDELRGYLK